MECWAVRVTGRLMERGKAKVLPRPCCVPSLRFARIRRRLVWRWSDAFPRSPRSSSLRGARRATKQSRPAFRPRRGISEFSHQMGIAAIKPKQKRAKIEVKYDLKSYCEISKFLIFNPSMVFSLSGSGYALPVY